MKLDKKLEYLSECLTGYDASYEDSAAHLCDLLELCRQKIITHNGMKFADLTSMVKYYGKNLEQIT